MLRKSVRFPLPYLPIMGHDDEGDMQVIVLPSGRRAIRKDGVLFQEMDFGNPPRKELFDKARWYQNLGAPEDGAVPPAHPVKLMNAPKAMFAEGDDGFVFAEAGDFLARDAAGGVAAVAAKRVRDYAALPVGADDAPEAVDAAARDMVERMSRVRGAAREQQQEEGHSPLSIREDDDGRALIVSTLPDGQEKTWKRFAWKSAAETFLGKDENREALEKDHEKACRRAESMNDLAHAFRMSQKPGVDR